MSRKVQTIAVDANDPQGASTALITGAVLPTLYEVSESIPDAMRPMLWASAITSLAGAMVAALGAEKAESIMLSVAALVPKIGDRPRNLH